MLYSQISILILSLLLFQTADARSRSRSRSQSANCANDKGVQRDFWYGLTDLQNVCARKFQKRSKKVEIRTKEGQTAKKELEKYRFHAEQTMKYKGQESIDSGDGAIIKGTDYTKQNVALAKEANDKSWKSCQNLEKNIKEKISVRCPAMLKKYGRALKNVMNEGEKYYKQQQAAADSQIDSAKKTENSVTGKTKDNSPPLPEKKPEIAAKPTESKDPKGFKKVAEGKSQSSWYGDPKDHPGEKGMGGVKDAFTGKPIADRSGATDSPYKIASNDLKKTYGCYSRSSCYVEITNLDTGRTQIADLVDHKPNGSSGVKSNSNGQRQPWDIYRYNGGDLWQDLGCSTKSGNCRIGYKVYRRSSAVSSLSNNAMATLSSGGESPNQAKTTALGMVDQNGEVNDSSIRRMIASHDFCNAYSSIGVYRENNPSSSGEATDLINELKSELSFVKRPSGDESLMLLCQEN